MLAMNDWKKLSNPAFEEYEAGIFVCATTGNGDAPENAEKFWRFLKRRTQPKTLLANRMHFAVLGLGDTNYDKFCHMGKSMDARLSEVGGRRMHNLGTADEAVGLEGTVEPWIETLYPALMKALGRDGVGAKDTTLASVGNGDTSNKANEDSTLGVGPETGREGMARQGEEGAPAMEVERVAVEGKVEEKDAEPHVADRVGLPQARGGPLTQASGAQWVESLLAPADFQQIREKALAAAKDRPWTAYTPSVKVIFMDESGPGAECTPPVAEAHPIPKRGSPPRSSTSSQSSLPCSTPLNHGGASLAPPAAPSPTALKPPSPFTGRLSPFTGVTGGGRAAPTGAAPLATLQAQGASYSYEHPAQAKVRHAVYLTKTAGDGHHSEPPTRRVLELELDTQDCDPPFPYVPGDAVGIRCPNRTEAVERVLERVGREGGRAGNRKSRLQVTDGVAVGGVLGTACWTLEEVVREVMDLEGTPKPHVLKALAAYTQDEGDQALLWWLGVGGEGGKALYESWILEQRLSLAEVLELIPSAAPTLAALLDLLPPLPARYYSVASSPLVCPTRLRIAFSVVEYELPRPGGGVIRRTGVCTSWMERMLREAAGPASGDDKCLYTSSRAPSLPPSLPLYLKPAKEFVLPGSPSWPLILVGPGTGVAPFMGFLSHRQARREALKHSRSDVCSGYWRGDFDVWDDAEDGAGTGVEMEEEGIGSFAQKGGEGPIWLFFGCRTKAGDWIYREEMENFLKRGVLSELQTAFSRESARKVYVQDRMQEQGEALARMLLKEGAYLYVCGDAENMARDVHASLRTLLVQHGGRQEGLGSEEEAEAFLVELKQRQRYVLDIWA